MDPRTDENVSEDGRLAAIAGRVNEFLSATRMLYDLAWMKFQTRLSWAKIGAKVGITAQSAHQRRAQLAGATSHG